MTFLFEFTPLVIIIVILAFVFELLDASLGIGFGTVLTPILLVIGLSVSKVVPSILLAELLAGIVAMIFHTLLKNVKLGSRKIFRRKGKRKRRVRKKPAKSSDANPPEISSLKEEVKTLDLLEIEELDGEEIIIEDEEEFTPIDGEELEEITIKNKSFIFKLKNLTTDTKVIILLSIVGILATIIAAILNVLFDYNDWFNFSVKIYIGIMVLSMGVLVLAFRNKEMKLSMRRILGLGILAGFNKGISGGGYRPITVAGQLLSGRKSRNALASTTFSKTVICFVGILTYILTHIIQNLHAGIPITWEYLELAPYLSLGTIVAAPIGAFITKSVDSKKLKTAIGWATIVLGVFSIIRLSLLQAGIWDKIPPFVEILESFS
ncbi:MAG: sulfite exporter TauE/SafE family protein [Candidatus Heimdallarchaeota archaeon]|nr:sulfite exporter TauE/SafE family protein [Candidatus Heimdallarchaeota archaeon]